eukprot:748716-Hanusia_phi.AAC.1
MFVSSSGRARLSGVTWRMAKGMDVRAKLSPRMSPAGIFHLNDPFGPSRALRDLVKMTRPQNIPAELGLSLAGSLFASRSLACLTDPLVWLVALFSASVGVGSMLINDYFDYRSGADAYKQNPIAVGTVHPEQALLAASSLYLLCSVFASILLESFPLRALVGTSLLLTFLYTPVLKGIIFFKNVVVAFVIAQAVVLGGFAVGGAGVSSCLLPALYVFALVLWQELLMDIRDMQGDAEAGIRTVPVALGKTFAASLALASASLAASLPVMASGYGLLSRCALPLVHLPLLYSTLRLLLTREVEAQGIGRALGLCEVTAALAMLVLAAA